jgi:mono/diheme cytochrome c family protein
MKLVLTILGVALVLAANLALGQGAGDVLAQGREIYENNCADCHRSNGEGLPVKFPALNKNPYVLGDPSRVIQTVLNGRKGELGLMPSWKNNLDDQKIAAVVTYIRHAWTNQAPAVTPETVAAIRGK